MLTSRALSTGTLVKSVVTLIDTSFRPGGISNPFSLSTSSSVCDNVTVLTHQGVMMLAKYFVTLYLILPQLDTIGLRG